MKQDYTHISVILDRTGSMESIRDDTIGGFNTFLNDQKAQPGTATMTLVQFDTQDPYEVLHQFKPIQDVPELTREVYVPRSGTPLLDALGRGINDLEQALAKLQEDEHPARVMMVVVTDGEENSSVEFTKEQIEKMISERTEKDDWQFVFLSADLSAIQEARSMGVQRSRSLRFSKDSAGAQAAWSSLRRRTAEYRGDVCCSVGFSAMDRVDAGALDDLDDPDDEDDAEKKAEIGEKAGADEKDQTGGDATE